MTRLGGLVYALIITATLLSSCKKSNTTDPNPTVTTPIDTAWSVYYSATELPKSTLFNEGIKLGEIQNKNLYELSGIAASYVTSNAFWVEQDSGNPSIIYLFAKEGTQLGSLKLNSVSNRDWEDIATGPGPMTGVSYIYLADIGDNKSQYPVKYIYRFPEPTITAANPNQEIATLDKITFRFPDGTKNAEAVMIDPLTKDLYIVSKEGSGATIYVANYPQDVTKEFVLVKVGTLPVSTITAGDISPDGSEVVIKNYSQIFYWKKSGNETISQLMKKPPVLLPYTFEPQGEAICWGADGYGYYTTSEVIDSTPAAISFYKRK